MFVEIQSKEKCRHFKMTQDTKKNIKILTCNTENASRSRSMSIIMQFTVLKIRAMYPFLTYY